MRALLGLAILAFGALAPGSFAASAQTARLKAAVDAAVEPAPAAPAPAEGPEAFEAKLAIERAAVEKERAELAARPPEEVAAELDVLDRTLGVFNEYDAIRTQTATLAEQEAAGVPQVVAELGKPPYDLDALDRVQAARNELEGRLAQFQQSQAISADEAAATRSDLELREEARRKAREAAETLDAAADPAAALAARRALRLAELESRRAELRRDLLVHIRGAVERQAALLGTQEHALREALGRVRKGLAIGPDALAARLARLDELEASIGREQEQAQTRIAERETRLARSQRALEKTTEPAAALVAEVAAFRAELQAAKQQAALLTEQMAHVSAARELWRGRSQTLAGNITRAELRARAGELTQSLDETERTLRIQQAVLAGMRTDGERARNDATRASEKESPTAKWKDREARAIENAIAAREHNIRSLEELHALQRRAADDLAARGEVGGWRRPLRAVSDGVARFWDRELTNVDDHPITFGKLVVAFGVLLLGWGLAHLLARVAARFVRRRTRAAEGAARAIETLTFYAFVAVFVLVALRIVNIPLTAFALAGGALAVGIGFGSQAILNNFISGLILLTERPIQIGDIIEMDGTQGVIERIGPRSTRIRTFEGIHLIVPNSAFLERNVVNLTLSDDLVRGAVEVGVAYGSDPRAVEKVLDQVLKEHPQVLEDPPPGIELAAFGESALVFKTFFWVRDVTLRGKVASDVRYRLVEELQKAGIELAFPQRDVHLDARAAFPVRIVREDRGPDADR